MPATPAPPVALPPISAPPGLLPPPPVPPGPVPALPITSEHRTANDACIQRLKQLHMQPGVKVYPKTMPPAVIGTDVDVQTNVFGLEVHSHCEVFQYMVNIKADLSPTKEVVFTKKGREDFVVVDRHEKCCKILFHAVEKNEDFFQIPQNCFIYDGQNVLFSTIDIFAGYREGATKTKVFQIIGADVDQGLQRFECIKAEVYASKNPVVRFSQEDVGRRTCDSNIESVNRAYHNILELALNQSCIRDSSRCVVFEHGKLFFFKPLDEGYIPADCIEVGDGKKMVPGIKKTVQFIEGPYGRGQNNPSVVIDAMKVAFHKDQLVLDKLKEVSSIEVLNGLNDFERERCAAVIKGLDCYSNYLGRLRHLRIEGIHFEGPASARFQLKDGGTSTVFDYFKDRHGITLQYPKANLIVCKERGNLNFYPMELMYITPNQRVAISQQTSAQSQKTTKESAVLPDVRQRLIMTGKAAAKITADNRILNELGVTVCDEPLMVKGRQLPCAKIAIKTTASLPMKDSKWRINQYTRPAYGPRIWALYCVGTQNTRFSGDMLRKFGQEYMTMFKSKGVDLPNPTELACVGAAEIEAKLKEAAKSYCQFVFVITDDSITNLHQKYKLIENMTSMIIQDMKLTKALSVISQGKRLTLENVVHKSNVKLGGTNYIFNDTNKYLDGTLIVGIGISNPPPGTKFVLQGRGILNPMIIGFAYNGQNSQEFSGDFVLSPAGQDTLAPIEDIMTQCIMGYQKWHNGEEPKRIIVYRSGTSEGNHGAIMAYEVPLARSAVENFSPKIHLVYITVSKDHTYRFFKNNLAAIARGAPASGSQVTGSGSRSSVPSGGPKPCDMNIGPGLAIDTGVTNPACKQFFLNSHITLQGSAKTPLYSVLMDDTNARMDSLEDLTYNLCHLHQIVGLPTSLPTPLYVANEYAKRGRNLWNEANQREPELLGDGSERTRLQEITNTINYKAAGDLIDRRVNA